MAVETGTQAPEFTLKDQDTDEVSLSGVLADKAVALVFFPFAFSGICESELCALRDDLSRYEAAGVQVLAVSCDARHPQRVWAEQEGYGFPLLSDFWPHGEVAKAYGVFDDALGCARRATFLIAQDGTIVDAFESGGIGEAREGERYAEALAKL